MLRKWKDQLWLGKIVLCNLFFSRGNNFFFFFFILVTVQCTKNLGCFLLEKQTAKVKVWRYPLLFFTCLQCFCVSIPAAVRPTFFFKATDGYGIFNMCTNLGACHKHKGTQTSLHMGCLEGIQKLSFTLPHQGIEPKVFRFEFRRCNQ